MDLIITPTIQNAAKQYAADMNRFLRDLIRIPGEGQKEGDAVARICAEMRMLGFDHVWIDRLGNALGSVGTGKKSSPLMDMLTLSVLVHARHGASIPTRALRMMCGSAAAAHLTSAAELSRLFMALKL